jgi:hypothetical protein
MADMICHKVYELLMSILNLYTGCPKKNYTLFDFMYRKTY